MYHDFTLLHVLPEVPVFVVYMLGAQPEFSNVALVRAPELSSKTLNVLLLFC